MGEFRPISLCNVSYKIISKLLSKRLKIALPCIISETQSAFMAGRQITDNILLAQENFHALRTNPMCHSKFMAIKTDMSKAYDRVEWNFLEALMLKLGFAEQWVRWIMTCVSTVSYQVLINGQAKGDIRPSRGLRQGDPLSSFMFILCTEALIGLLRGAEEEHRITGLKIARSSPSISHLLFADDSLFFCKANFLQSAEIIGIIRTYGLSSGQQLNLTKSSLVFGKKVGEDIKRNIKRITGINREGGTGVYLGIPEQLAGAKTKVFAFVQDRLNNRINNWSAKFLSKGGKEVLIKSVAQAIPTFVMSCFLLPKGTTQKLKGATSNFWWRSNQNSRGIHWTAWDKICVPLNLGGLGFRDLHAFNLALLAKQFWRLLRFPSSLIARVFRSRYYMGSNPLSAKKPYSPSYGWRSLLAARALIQCGIRKTIGSGLNTKVWSEPWIPDLPARLVRGIIRPRDRDPNLLVHSLIKTDTKEWDEPMIRSLFQPSDVGLILGLRPSHSFTMDGYAWSFTKSGTYTVRSGYEMARQPSHSREAQPVMEPSISALQSHIWTIRTSKKLKHFLWQSVSGYVATCHQLFSRHIGKDGRCPRCGAHEETINHLLFECPPALQVWALSLIPSSPGFFPSRSLYQNLDFLFWRTKDLGLSDIQRGIYPWILWYIWKARNDKVFKGKETSPEDTIQFASLEAESWRTAYIEGEQEEEEEARVVGEVEAPPETTQFPTCQIDASWTSNGKVSGIGWCLKENVGRFLLGMKGCRRSLSALHAELDGLLWTMSCLVERNILSVTIETDCMDLIKMVSQPLDWPTFLSDLDHFSTLRDCFRVFSLRFIPRSSNIRADSLAKRARARDNFFYYVGYTDLD